MPIGRLGRLNGDGPLHDALGGGQVALQEQRRQGQHVADVVEAVADVVGGEVLGRLEIDADEVADGVVVFDAVEPADGDPARIAFAGAIGTIEDGGDGAGELLDVGDVGPRPALRRHFARLQRASTLSQVLRSCKSEASSL